MEHHKIPSVVLFIPSTGSVYSPRFLSDTTRLQAKGLWLRNCRLATDTVLKMLPSVSLRLLKDGSIPGNQGLLSEITDIYRLTITSVCNPITTLLPVLCGIHVHDKDICIPPDIFLGRSDCVVRSTESAGTSNSRLREVFVQSLSSSKSNRTLCR